MTHTKRMGGLALVVAISAALLAPASAEVTETRGGIVIDLGTADVAPGWIVNLGTVICPAETEAFLWHEEYSDGATFLQEDTAATADFTPWQTGEPVGFALAVDEGSATGPLTLSLTCTDEGLTAEYGFARIALNVLARFADVAPGAFFDDAVMWARLNGITTGTSATTFSPDDAVSRWQMALFLQRLASSFEDTTANIDGFSDTGALRDDFRRAIGWLADTGVTTGIGGNRYDPNGSVPRWQMALFLFRLADHLGTNPTSQVDTFSDTAALRSDFRGAVGWLAATGITTGVGNNRFDPNGTVSRGQMVTFLQRFFEWLATG